MKTKEYIEAEKKVREILPNWVELKNLIDRPIAENRYLIWCILEEMCIEKIIKNPGPSELPAYVAVIEFGTPASRMEKL